MGSVRKGLRTAAAAAAAATLAAAIATGPADARGARQAAACGSFHALINGAGTTVRSIAGSRVSCATARKVALAWVYGFDHHNGDQYCAPRPQDGPHVCKIGRWRCRAVGVSGASAERVGCGWRRRTVRWRADLDQSPQPDAVNLNDPSR